MIIIFVFNICVLFSPFFPLFFFLYKRIKSKKKRKILKQKVPLFYLPNLNANIIFLYKVFSTVAAFLYIFFGQQGLSIYLPLLYNMTNRK